VVTRIFGYKEKKSIGGCGKLHEGEVNNIEAYIYLIFLVWWNSWRWDWRSK